MSLEVTGGKNSSNLKNAPIYAFFGTNTNKLSLSNIHYVNVTPNVFRGHRGSTKDQIWIIHSGLSFFGYLLLSYPQLPWNMKCTKKCILFMLINMMSLINKPIWFDLQLNKIKYMGYDPFIWIIDYILKKKSFNHFRAYKLRKRRPEGYITDFKSAPSNGLISTLWHLVLPISSKDDFLKIGPDYAWQTSISLFSLFPIYLNPCYCVSFSRMISHVYIQKILKTITGILCKKYHLHYSYFNCAMITIEM